MRVLFVHNRYGITTGEEIMIQRIISLLQERGHVVETFYRGGSLIESVPDKLKAFFSGIWSISSRRALKIKLEAFQPDIVQVQNLFPSISPSVLPVLKHAGIPVVMRLSNYRLICPSGLLLSHGELCERCLGGKEQWCVLRNCEGDWLKSLGYALRNWVARKLGLYTNNVTGYYAQTRFQKNLLVFGGFAAEKINVIPNMVELPNIDEESQLGEYVGFVGRMSPEKGVDVFLQAAMSCPSIPFKIAGDSGKFKSSQAIPENVELLGHLDRKDLDLFYQQCRFVIVPSLCYEGFPGVIIEAMRHGKPVIVSHIGGLPEIVDDHVTGLLFEPGNDKELARIVENLWEDSEVVRVMGQAGQNKVVEYSPELYYQRLMAVYTNAISEVTSKPQSVV